MDESKEVVVLPAKAWRDFTWMLIKAALNRPGNRQVEDVQAEIKPILDLEALARYGTPQE